MKLSQRTLSATFLTLVAAICSTSAQAAFVSDVEMHFVSGPVDVGPGQSANACATNPDDSPVAVLIALLQADTGNILQTRQMTLQPGRRTCLAWTSPLQSVGQSPAIYAVVVPNGRIDSAGQTILYALMIKHHHYGNAD